MPGDHNGETATKRSSATTKPAGTNEQEQLACPRCDSTNTKFCYYNNYNFSQPRHFCKSCRRYWTHGGALRDIPVGGGSRRSSKRSRTSSSSSTTAAASATPLFLGPTCSGAANPLLLPLPTNHLPATSTAAGAASPCGGGSFASLLNTQGPPGFLALGGFGLGLEDVGAACFGLGRGLSWAFPDLMEDGGCANSAAAGRVLVGGGGNNGNAGGHMWQLESGGSAFVGVAGSGDCFPWPDLAISTPGNGLK